MPIEFKELPGWLFEVDEVSAGVYKATGKDELGRNIEITGIEPNELIEKCKEAAMAMDN